MFKESKSNMRKLAFLLSFVFAFALLSISARADVLYNQSFINHTFSCAVGGSCLDSPDVVGEQFDINSFFGTANITSVTFSLSAYTPSPTDAVVYFFNNSGGGGWSFLAQSLGFVKTTVGGYDWYNFTFAPFQIPQSNFGEALFGLYTHGATITFNDANGNDSLNIGYDGFSQTYVSSFRISGGVSAPARQEDLALRIYNGSAQYQFYYVTGCSTSPISPPAQVSCSPPSIPIPSSAVAGSIVVREVTNIYSNGNFQYNNPNFAVQTCTPNNLASCGLNSQICAPSTLAQPYVWYNYTYQAGNTASGYSSVNIPQGCFVGDFFIQGNLIVSALVTSGNDSVTVINQTTNTISQICSNGIQTTSYGNGTLVSVLCSNGCKDQLVCNAPSTINPTQSINGANALDQSGAIINAVLTPMGIGTIVMMVLAVMLAGSIKRDSGLIFAVTVIVMSTFYSVVGIYPFWVAIIEIVLSAFGVVIFANKLRQ